MPHVRKFDHDEACQLYRAGARISDLAKRFGVTDNAVGRVVDARWRATEARAREAYETRHRTGCEVCGKPCLALTHAARRDVDGRALCVKCRGHARLERLRFDKDGRLLKVRCSIIDCANGQRWQSPDNFTAGDRHRDVRDGGIHGLCRACQTRAKRDYRQRHAQKQRAYDREYKRRKRAAA